MLKKIQRFLQNLIKPNTLNAENDYQIASNLIEYMTKLISIPMQAKTVLEQADAFLKLPTQVQEKELPKIYLLMEQYIVEVDALKIYSRKSLRSELFSAFPAINEITSIAFIFQENTDLVCYLCRLYLGTVLTKVEAILGKIYGDEIQETKKWIYEFPNHSSEMPLAISFPEKFDKKDFVGILAQISTTLFTKVVNYLGAEMAIRIWENAYQEINEIYGGLETFPNILQLLPSQILDDTKLRLLSRVQIEATLLKQANELKAMNDQLIGKNEELHKVQNALLTAKNLEKETHQLMSTIIETVGECIITIDEKSQIVMANRETEETWGYENGELQGQKLEILMPPEFRNQHHQGLSRYLNTKKSHILGKWVIVSACKKDGTIFPIELKIMETRIGEKRLFTAALHDITERIKNENLLKQKNEELDIIMHKASHDLRGPITSILALTQLIESQPENHVQFTKMIEKSIYKLDETIRDLMSFGQLSNPNVVASKVNLYALCKEVIESICRIDGFDEVRIDLAFEDSFSFIAKPNLLKSIFQNLISNSVNYRRKEIASFIHISLLVEKNIVITIRDNGQGIAPQYHAKIFDRFYRANTKVAGTGLGLYIVRKSAESLGGTIEMESVENEGTTFYLTLPLEQK